MWYMLELRAHHIEEALSNKPQQSKSSLSCLQAALLDHITHRFGRYGLALSKDSFADVEMMEYCDRTL
eukprot:scaffold44215_cov17-Prasinocladus_malaysianus.AAC.1